ncbi:Macrophage migration inhibitory factor [Trichuris trichiura]|nr:Macrophage migration inhibitory factor [Trichuris trichiura]
MMNDQLVRVGTEDENCLIATLSSIGKIGADFNQEHLDKLCAFFQKQLNISPERLALQLLIASNSFQFKHPIQLPKMPIFTFSTNVPSENISVDFLKSTSKLIAGMLGKPESYVAVHINGGQKITFGGTDAPAGFGQLLSLGGVGGEKNRSHSAKLFKHLTDGLGIPGNRMYINFVDMRGSDVGYNGSTF